MSLINVCVDLWPYIGKSTPHLTPFYSDEWFSPHSRNNMAVPLRNKGHAMLLKGSEMGVRIVKVEAILFLPPYYIIEYTQGCAKSTDRHERVDDAGNMRRLILKALP